jgi:hypothetical protein
MRLIPKDNVLKPIVLIAWFMVLFAAIALIEKLWVWSWME